MPVMRPELFQLIRFMMMPELTMFVRKKILAVHSSTTV